MFNRRPAPARHGPLFRAAAITATLVLLALGINASPTITEKAVEITPIAR